MRTPNEGEYGLAVIGAGSAGIAAALAASRLGLSVLLVEAADVIGGTMVRAGINVWEMGAGTTGIPFDLYKRLKRLPGGASIYSFGRHQSWPAEKGKVPFPGGELVPDPALHYRDTLQRHVPPGQVADEAYCRAVWHGVIIDPDQYLRAVHELLAETGRCTLLTSAPCVGVDCDADSLRSVRLADGSVIRARSFIDATGDAVVCAAAGCEMMSGQEPRSRFGEPGAPEQPTDRINGVTLVYRVTPAVRSLTESLPPEVPEKCWWRPSLPSVSAARLPSGDYMMNMLPTLEGREYLDLGPAAAYAEARRRVLCHWHFVQSNWPEFRGYRLSWIAPALGVRESRRVVTEYILTQLDLMAGLSGQNHKDLIAVADHAMDRHGQGGHGGEVRQPYGVPYRCLLPRGMRNLLVACRAAGFSALAASSCRLTRTMMELGQAAGTAAALADRLGVSLNQVPPETLRSALREQHVQLEWPTPPELTAYLAREDA